MSPAASRENLEKIKRVSDSPKTKPVSERVPSESESVKEMAKKISEKGTMPQPDFSDNIYKGPPPNEADTEYLTMQVKDLTEKLNILKYGIPCMRFKLNINFQRKTKRRSNKNKRARTISPRCQWI